MGEKLVIGPINKGLRTDREPFVIDNDSFPQLINAFQWRGRVKRKRGTVLLNRLQRAVSSFTITLTTNAGQTGQLPNTPVVPGTINLVGSVDGTTYTDPTGNGTLTATGGTGTGGSVNYSTGAITILAGGGENLTGTISYYPCLPVMGLEDLTLSSTQFPDTLGFDTTYSYNIPTTNPYTPQDVSFYKNPGTPNTPKPDLTATTWNGANYQQFWTTNYNGALWATNGVGVTANVFSTATIGMQYAGITGNTNNIITSPVVAADVTATTITVTISNCPLIIGDYVFANEWDNSSIATGINFQTGYVTACAPNTPTPANKTLTITFPNANITTGIDHTPGILQYLTNRSDTTKDVIRWYDGNPNGGTGLGWVNFMPSLSKLDYTISALPVDQYYLVGCRMIVPFKDRLLFIGAVVQTSSGGPIYLQDTVVYSQNGTPYYTCSFADSTSNYAVNPTINYHQLLVPNNQTATPSAYFADNTGFGGFVSPALDQPITTVGVNEDALIMGLSTIQVRFIYSGNDIIPFNFYIINAELGSASTFSTVIMDEAVITRGTRGFIMTNQVSCKRFDLDILPNVFTLSLTNNGNERFCAQRDYINEWIYFTYLSNSDSSIYVYPNQTLLYNYRDASWGLFNENYTTYGQFRKQTGDTWLTITYPWNSWTDPWNSGETTLLQPQVIAGNQQGFVLVRDDSTVDEATSLFVQSVAGVQITSPDHGLLNGDTIILSSMLGITFTPALPGNIFTVSGATQNTFNINSNMTGTYGGGGLITRIYNPIIQSKQFPIAWAAARKTRIGPQQYMLTTTPNGRCQLLIYTSQNTDFAYNDNSIVPVDDTVYQTTLYTCPESTNLGLTPANTNLQMMGASAQDQIWHRINTSLIGDTVQFAITLSPEQLTDVDDDGNPISQFSDIELHACVIDITPSSILA